MRLLFFVLLLVNAAAFAYYTFHAQAQIQSRPALPEMNAERIRMLNIDQSSGSLGVDSAKSTCWIWRGLTAETMQQANVALEALALGDKVTQPVKEEFWLYIPPLKNLSEAQKKLTELKSLTINDGVVEERGKWRFAISIAAYATEEEATVRFNQLKEKGVKSAKILKRDATKDAIAIQQVDAKTATALNDLQRKFNETVLTQVACKTP